jgi:hypothetical protein
MDADTDLPEGSPTTALSAPTHGLYGPRTELSAATDGARAELGHPAQPPARNPAELLAGLLDFPGSVALAELLEGDARALPHAHAVARDRSLAHGTARFDRALPAGALGERLLLDAEARLDSLEPVVLKPLVGRRAPTIPTPPELLFQLARFRLIAAPDQISRARGPAYFEDAEAAPPIARGEADVRRFADDLGAPFRSALGLSLRQAQANVATLRWEITHDLRALGPHADQLERLDAAISRSIQAKLGELLDRMEHAAHLTFVRACLHAVEALPAQVDEQTLAAWCDANGWLVRYRERCVRMAKALFGHLRRNLEGLLRAATDNDDWMGDP